MRRCGVRIVAVGLTPWSIACGAVANAPSDASATDGVAISDDATSDVVVDSGGDAYLEEADAPWPGDGEGGQALDCSGSGDDWPMFGQNVCNTRSAQGGGPISPSTASRLAVKWVFKAAGDISATPAIVGIEVYVPDWGGMLHRIVAQSGQLGCSRSVGGLVGMSVDAASGTDTPAAVISRVTPVVTDDSVILGPRAIHHRDAVAGHPARGRSRTGSSWQTPRCAPGGVHHVVARPREGHDLRRRIVPRGAPHGDPRVPVLQLPRQRRRPRRDDRDDPVEDVHDRRQRVLSS
jgi:hypothetical protein